MTGADQYVHRSRAGGCYALLVLLGVFPAMFVGSFLEGVVGLAVVTAPIVVLVLLAAAVYWAISMEHRLVVGASSLRLTEREAVLGFQRPERVLWEVPLAELTGVTEVTTRTPSSRGGWSYGVALHFPGARVLRADMLGSKDAPASEYNRLVRWLRERLGDRFTTEERT